VPDDLMRMDDTLLLRDVFDLDYAEIADRVARFIAGITRQGLPLPDTSGR
jgi:hypothetical protein